MNSKYSTRLQCLKSLQSGNRMRYSTVLLNTVVQYVNIILYWWIDNTTIKVYCIEYMAYFGKFNTFFYFSFRVDSSCFDVCISVALWTYILSLIISCTFLAWWWFIPDLAHNSIFILFSNIFIFFINNNNNPEHYSDQFVKDEEIENIHFIFKTLLEAERN